MVMIIRLDCCAHILECPPRDYTDGLPLPLLYKADSDILIYLLLLGYCSSSTISPEVSG